MGLFDSLSGLAGQFESIQSSALAGPVVDALRQQGVDGVDGLVAQFQNSGFGAHVTSWVSETAENLPLSQDDVQQVLGSSVVQNLATKLGLDTNQVSSLLAQHLPGIIGHLSAGGEPAQS